MHIFKNWKTIKKNRKIFANILSRAFADFCPVFEKNNCRLFFTNHEILLCKWQHNYKNFAKRHSAVNQPTPTQKIKKEDKGRKKKKKINQTEKSMCYVIAQKLKKK